MTVSTLIIFILVLVAVNGQLLKPPAEKLSEDGRLNFTGIAEKYGHASEHYEVTTEDGYILTVFRIPGNISKPVLMVHGNTPTSDCFIIRGNDSLAITMAKQNYDVWAINLRGTRYSRRHITLNPDLQPNQFFDYSFYEQGVFDLPATIDFVLNKTGQNKLLLIGHSVGTTLIYVMGSERPEYNDKITLAVSLAPICFLEHLRGLTTISILVGPLLSTVSGVLNTQELLSHAQITPILQTLCLNPAGYGVCVKGLFSSLAGTDLPGLEPEFLPTLLGHYPGGTTRKIFQHLLQLIRRNKFAQFDYGLLRNLAVYGRVQPPQFDLNKVTMKTAILVGSNDYLSSVPDAERLNSSLPNVVDYFLLPYKDFNHFDFIWGRQMSSNLFPFLFDIINKHS